MKTENHILLLLSFSKYGIIIRIIVISVLAFCAGKRFGS